MKIYVARQPIYNSDKSLFGYELLYRNSENNYYPNINEDKATRELTYNVLSEFNLNSLINDKYGFINFTKESLMSDLPLHFNPENIIIEILENVTLDQELIDKITYLKNKNYILALDDFIDDGTYDKILPYIDIIKVEYSLLDSDTRRNIAQKYKNSKKLIAERIETEENYKNALNDGYELFQGYYFSRPIIMSKARINIASSTYICIWKEISKEDIRINSLADIIKLDAGLTYKLFSLMNTPLYYRGNKINSVKHALVRLGIVEIKKWTMVLFLRDISNADNDEFAKVSLIRAIFMEKLMVKLGHENLSQDTYIVGLLSMIDNILQDAIVPIFDILELQHNVKDALINKDGLIYEALECIKEYELGNWDKVEGFNQRYNLDSRVISLIYVESLKYADNIFMIDNN